MTWKDRARWLIAIPFLLLLSILLVVLSPVLVLAGLARKAYGAWLVRRFRREYASAGTVAILVYSQSPNWQAYIEEHVLPKLGHRAVVLDWSERRLWKRNATLPIRVYQHHRPGKEFNPYAMVFWPAGRPREVRFFQAFRDFKHGREHTLETALREFFDSLEGATKAWNTFRGATAVKR
jgi:hypothetical protein